MKTVKLPNLLWYGNEPKEIFFPDDWEVEVLEPPGFSKPALDEAAIALALDRPIGSPSLDELASGANEVAIVFDDITRPTPVSLILPGVLNTLARHGIPDANIRFIPALGMHGAMTNVDFRKKLGGDVVRRFAIYNHNPYENCDYLGESPGGMPVYINREFMSCDLKIGIGCITPHIHVGFGGGGKIILPGIAGAETIKAFHGEVMMRDPQSTGMGRFDGNVMYSEVADVVGMSGLGFVINALINDRGEVTDLFAGDPVESHLAGVDVAKEHYATPASPGNDVAVVNAYAKYNEMSICMLIALTCVNYTTATVVLMVDAPEGQVCHYLIRSFGKEYGGSGYMKRDSLPDFLEVVVCSAYPDQTMCDLFAPNECVKVTCD
jgi:nickel-dependent lactate racemase